MTAGARHDTALAAVQGIVLAGGASRRFGSDKRLAEVDGEPLLLRALRPWLQACGEGLCGVLVVLRAESPGERALAARIQALGARTTFCADAALGMGHSLAWGVAQTAAAAGWVVGLGDMPALRAASIGAVARALGAGRIVLPMHGGQRGHPVGFDAVFGDALRGLRGDTGARALLQQHAAAVRRIELDDSGTLLDVDAPAQLGALRGR